MMDRTPIVYFTPEIAESIALRYLEGESLLSISRDPAVPSYATILKWARDNDGFRNQLKNARQLRALHMEEMALQVAEATEDKDDVPAAKLKVDTYKWVAEVSDPDTYGKKTTVQGNASAPIMIVVKTGVPDADDEQEVILNAQGLVEQKEPKTSDKLPDIAAEYVVSETCAPKEASDVKTPSDDSAS